MPDKLFIDCHCHLFNIVDIPLYATLEGKVEMGTLKRLVSSFVVSGALTLGFGDNILKSKEEFIRFFERDIESNIIWLSGQVREAVPDGHILMTPLVMDFDPIHDNHNRNQQVTLAEPNVKVQLRRLLDAIRETKDRCNGVYFSPFVGFDLRKLYGHGYGNGLSVLQKMWQEYGTSPDDRRNKPLESGAVFGIKLYPPIGFNPNPSDSAELARYLEFYKWCCSEDIPLTTHCQGASGSFSVGISSRKVNKRTHGKNWWHLFKNNPEIQSLRINFAHFGGEEGMEDLVDWYGVDEDSWTYYLIKLLKRFPNTYADISAYDFSDDEACDNLLTVLKKDKDGEFDREGTYSLSDKLLWGSDVPMVISSRAYRKDGKKHGEARYVHLYEKFKDILSSMGNMIIEKMSYDNPASFLTLK